MAGIFISYRRKRALVVRQFYERIRAAFPKVDIFLDRPAIKPGKDFPDEINRALASAEIVLVIIDPTWISAADEASNRRRLDMRNDWVRIEIARSLKENKIVIPVLIEGAKMPAREELPAPLRVLTKKNAAEIDDRYYDEDVNALVEEMRKNIIERKLRDFDDYSNPYPKARAFRPKAIDRKELKKMLGDLPRWRVVRSTIEDDLGPKGPKKRVEIERKFKFPSFRAAMRFMNAASKRIDPYDHHPRWENIYDEVRVRLSTWDSGHIFTDRDFKTALMLERLYGEFLREL